MSNIQNAEMDIGSPVPEEPSSSAAISSSDSDKPILRLKRGKKRRKSSYVDFGKVYEIFPGMDTKVLGKLSELDDIIPSKVIELVPEASAVQITAFMKLAEDTAQKRKKERRAESGLHGN